MIFLESITYNKNCYLFKLYKIKITHFKMIKLLFYIFMSFMIINALECDPNSCENRCCINGVCANNILECKFVANKEFNYLVDTLIALAAFIIGKKMF